MTFFKVALIQLKPPKNFSDSLSLGIKACKQAKKLGADLALFPEAWQIGYEEKFMHLEYAIDINNKYIKTFQKLAHKIQMAIAITYIGKKQEYGSEKPTNSVALIDMTGKIILDYAKVHICQFDSPENRLASGTEFKIASLSFSTGTVNIGAMICFDREFPESARSLMLKGAEIILTPNACFMYNDPWISDVRIAQFRARAFENMVGVALANYSKPKNDGHSCAFDVDGSQLIMLDSKEKISLVTFDLEKIRKWQSEEFWGATLRKPDCYTYKKGS